LTESAKKEPGPPPPKAPIDFTHRHLRIGWIALATFVTLGMALEALHAFKVGNYLDVDHSTRRLMWTLSHSHGTLLGLVNLAYAALFERMKLGGRGAGLISHFLVGATVLVPGGFFLGGASFHDGDPGLGVLLVPLGGAMLVVALFGIAFSLKATR
jgi:hypothetical protein